MPAPMMTASNVLSTRRRIRQIDRKYRGYSIMSDGAGKGSDKGIRICRNAPVGQAPGAIGDAFMATANLLDDLDDPVEATVRCALAMVSVAKQSDVGWQVRIGIDHGSVVAGVIGGTSFQFDIWGDTVNTATRIEEVGTPGAVGVSGRAWQRLRGRAQGRSLSMVDLKGRAPIEVIECTAV